MEHCTRKPGEEKAIPEFGRDSIQQAMRLRIRDTIEELVKEELDAALGASKSVRRRRAASRLPSWHEGPPGSGGGRHPVCVHGRAVPQVRIGGRRERVPVLVTLGVRGTGERVVLDLRLVGEESAASWTEVVASLTGRHLARPVLAIIDGNPGLMTALRSHWPGIEIQRCAAHRLWNLQPNAPARLREELTEDYRRMIYGDTVAAVQHDRARFTKKWQLRCPAVVESLKEASDELFTFLRFPSSQWKALRTTNALERINEEFRRRTKTQASLPGQDAVVLLLFGLLRSGQIKLRVLDGYRDLKEVKKAA